MELKGEDEVLFAKFGPPLKQLQVDVLVKTVLTSKNKTSPHIVKVGKK